MKNNNKILTISLLVVIAILLIISMFVGEKNTELKLSNDPKEIMENAINESSKVTSAEKKDFTEIDISKYLEYYSGKDKKIVLLARKTCKYCQVAEPIIQKIAKDYKLDINYLNPDNFQDGDAEKLRTSDEYFKEGYGTPLLLIVENNKIVDKVDGLTDTAHYIEFFKKHKYIK